MPPFKVFALFVCLLNSSVYCWLDVKIVNLSGRALLKFDARSIPSIEFRHKTMDDFRLLTNDTRYFDTRLAVIHNDDGTESLLIGHLDFIPYTHTTARGDFIEFRRVAGLMIMSCVIPQNLPEATESEFSCDESIIPACFAITRHEQTGRLQIAPISLDDAQAAMNSPVR